MEIKNADKVFQESSCKRCKKKNTNEEKLNYIKFGFGWDNDTVLCDECLQELNRRIVEHLADKYL